MSYCTPRRPRFFPVIPTKNPGSQGSRRVRCEVRRTFAKPVITCGVGQSIGRHPIWACCGQCHAALRVRSKYRRYIDITQRGGGRVRPLSHPYATRIVIPKTRSHSYRLDRLLRRRPRGPQHAAPDAQHALTQCGWSRGQVRQDTRANLPPFKQQPDRRYGEFPKSPDGVW